MIPTAIAPTLGHCETNPPTKLHHKLNMTTQVSDPRLQYRRAGTLREVTNQCGDNRLGVPRNAGNKALNKGVTGYFRPPSAPYPPLPAASPTPVGATFPIQGMKVAYHAAIHSPLPGDFQSPPTTHAPQTWGKHVASNNAFVGTGAGGPSNAPWLSQPQANHQGEQCQSQLKQPIMLSLGYIPGGARPDTFSSECNQHIAKNSLYSGKPLQRVGQAAPAPAEALMLPYPSQQFVKGHYTPPMCAKLPQEQPQRVASLNRSDSDCRNGPYMYNSSTRGGNWGGATTPPPPAPYPPLPQSAPRSLGPHSPVESASNHRHWSAMHSPLPEDRPSPPQGPRRETPRARDTGAEKEQRPPRLPQPPNCDDSSNSKGPVVHCARRQATEAPRYQVMGTSNKENGNKFHAEGQHQQSRYGLSSHYGPVLKEEKPKPATNRESDRKHVQHGGSTAQGADGPRSNNNNKDRLSKEQKRPSPRDGDAAGVPGHYTPAGLEGTREKDRSGGRKSPSYNSGQNRRGLVDKERSYRLDRGGKEEQPESRPRRVEDPRLAHGRLKIRPSSDDGFQRRDERARDDSNISGRNHSGDKDRARGRAGGRVKGAAREGHRWGRHGVGKSCPPPRGAKDRSVLASKDASDPVSSQVQEKDKLAEISKQIDALDVDATNKSTLEEGQVDVVARAYFSLEEYKAAEKAGDVVYKGKSTVEELYAAGKAYNPTTRRWIKVENEEKKAVIQAAPSLLANMEMLENTVKLLTQRSQLLETKAEILKEQSTRPTVTLTTSTAPKLIVFDTNCFLHKLGGIKCRVADIADRQLDTSVLVPKAVLAELDGLKKNEAIGFSAREASRYLRSLLQTGDKRGFSVARFQEDVELYRDEGHHSAPHNLRGDASILNCCMFFTQGITIPREVILVTGDNNFEMQARANRFGIERLPRCLAERCQRPSCPARSQHRSERG